MRRVKSKTIDTGKSRKAAIIREAIKLFAKKGYYATTLDEIAKKLRVTKAALYYYVHNKEEIIKEINARSVQRMSKAISLGNSNLSPREKLREFIKYHVEFSAEGADESRVLFEQIHALPKKTRDDLKRKQREVDRTLQNIIQEGVEQGIFAVDDVKLVSFGILGLCNWTYHWYKPNGRLSPEQITEKFVHLLENGYIK